MKMSNKLRALLILLLVAGGATVLGCKPSPKVTEAIERFHILYNREEYAVIYAHADAGFKAATDEATFVSMMGRIRQKLGSNIRCEEQGRGEKWLISGNFVEVSCRSSFEKMFANEYFKFKTQGEDLVLYGYFIKDVSE